MMFLINRTKKRLAILTFEIALGLAIVSAMRVLPAGASEDLGGNGTLTADAENKPIELPSIQTENCKVAGDRGYKHDQCLRVQRLLAVMSGEPRAKAWADGMESYLRKWMENLRPDGFTFKDVKCRLSWCVLEAESSVGAVDMPGHNIILNVIEARNKRIFQLENMFAKDPNDVLHILALFKRFCISSRELIDADGLLNQDYDTAGEKCPPQN